MSNKGMMDGAYQDSWGLYRNPYGVTGVRDNNTGVGFSGGTEHIMFGNPFKPAIPNLPSMNNSPASTEQRLTPQEIMDKFFYGHGTSNETLQDTPAYINEGYDPTVNAQPDPNITTTDPTGNGGGFTFGGGSSDGDPAVNPENPNVDRVPIDFSSNYDPRGHSTPFLDAYIRSKEAAKAEGPVTGMMKKYME